MVGLMGTVFQAIMAESSEVEPEEEREMVFWVRQVIMVESSEVEPEEQSEMVFWVRQVIMVELEERPETREG